MWRSPVASSEGQVDAAIAGADQRRCRDDIVSPSPPSTIPCHPRRRGSIRSSHGCRRTPGGFALLFQRVDPAFDLSLGLKSPQFLAVRNREGVDQPVGVPDEDPGPRGPPPGDDRSVGLEGPRPERPSRDRGRRHSRPGFRRRRVHPRSPGVASIGGLRFPSPRAARISRPPAAGEGSPPA